MLPRPDSQSFTKFILSAGVFLLVAAFVLPGLVLRDTGVLTISRRELGKLTPTASRVLERRQGIAQRAGEAAPWVAGVLFAGGVLLIGFGVPRLRRQEQAEDERSEMELDKLRAELRPQTATEREERLRVDAEEDQRYDSESSPLEPEPALDDEVEQTFTEEEIEGSAVGHFFPQSIRQRAGLENEVLSRLAGLASPLYEVQPQVKVEGSPTLFLDALLVSQVDQLPDVIVEIKISEKFLARNIGNRIAELTSELLRYRSRFRRQSIGWLIFVVTEPLPVRPRQQVEEMAAEFKDELHVSLIEADKIDELVLPVSI